VIDRAGFRCAVEALTSDEPGPLEIDLGPVKVILASRQTINWSRYKSQEAPDH
jgi:hypothetical protein